MKQLNINGTKAQLDELIELLSDDGSATLSSGHVPVRPDLDLEIVFREVDEDDRDEDDPITYDLTEV